jgi:hypothetical protein
MSIMSRFAVALAAGLVAAGLNALALRSAAQNAGYVSFNRVVQQGDPVPATALAKVAVPGKPAAVGRALVPWKDRGLLVQMPAPRDYAAGDMALQRDVRDAIQIASRDKLPLLEFEVIAVGDRFKREGATEEDGGTAGRNAFVTVKVKRPDKPLKKGEAPDYAANSLRLIRVVTQRAALGKPAAEDRILGVAVFPRPDRQAASGAEPRTGDAPILQPAEDEMFLTVPLDGIESVPDLILVGGNIGFFMLPEYP